MTRVRRRSLPVVKSCADPASRISPDAGWFLYSHFRLSGCCCWPTTVLVPSHAELV